MRRILRQIVSILALHAVFLPAAEIMKVEEVRVGMTGHGITNLYGTEQIRFDVEITGILPSFQPDYPLIIGRMSHPVLEKTGIVEGMSGSPVYIDGKLLGAIAYGWSFAKEPYCGITPFETTLKDRVHHSFEGPNHETLMKFMSQKDYTALADLVLDSAGSFKKSFGEFQVAPLKLHGSFPIPLFRQFFTNLGFSTGPGGKGAANPQDAVTPGSPIAAALVEGPFPIYATGTVTHVDGDRIWIFGHPFLELGATSMPLARASTITTISSHFSSFRMATMDDVIGSADFDGRSGVSGTLGATSDMVSMTFRLDDRAPVKYRLIRDPLLSPVLASIVTSNELSNHPGMSGRGTYRIRISQTLDDGNTLTLEDTFSGESELKSISGTIISFGSLLTQNNYRRVNLDSIDVSIAWDPEPAWYTIRGLSVMDGSVRPGQEVDILLTLEDQDGGIQTRSFSLSVPAQKEGTELTCYLLSGATLLSLEEKLTSRKVYSYEGLLRYSGSIPPDHDLYALWSYPQKGLRYRDLFLSNPGPRLKALFPEGTSTTHGISKIKLDSFSRPLRGWDKVQITLEYPGGTP